MNLKPQLAEDALLGKVRFPAVAQPKIDGVRGLNLTGTFTGRSMDPFEGFGITEYFSHKDFRGLDGEMTLGPKPNCTDRLCSKTTGAMGRFKGVTEMADLYWWVFDYITDATAGLPYIQRYDLLRERIIKLQHPRLCLVPMVRLTDADHMKALIAAYAEEGFEGTIIRSPDAPYKEGRATQKGQQLWRVKPWADAEILVTGITEGEMNGNEAKKNTLGRTERSSAKAGMVPNGQVGSIQGTLLQDVYSTVTGLLLFPRGLPINVGPGEMTEVEAIHFFRHPAEIVGHIVKFKHMEHGVKDKPRMATYRSHRLAQDMVPS